MTTRELNRHACSVCARRKVKCDRGDPCSNCRKTRTHCLYEIPAPHRARKRAAENDLTAKLARYEELMQRHGIDFTDCANTWIPSGLEVKPKQNTTATLEPSLWSNLSPELKYPPTHNIAHKENSVLNVWLPFLPSEGQPELHKIHPEPKHIYRFWQIFVECVNPLTKVVHIPTLQQRVLDASWDTTSISKPLTAILFAIYALAVAAISSDDCQSSFGEARDVLFQRYRTATLRALTEAGFLATRDLEVLQAFFLFLIADPESELTSTLTGAAIRIGLKIGLHREKTNNKFSIFEKEMRIRLWWQLYGLDCRSHPAATQGMTMSALSELFGDVRAPLNLNDADLHPDMTETPIEQTGPTEMLCVLFKYEVFHWARSSPTADRALKNITQGPVGGKISTTLEDEGINELEAIYRAKYFQNLDKSVPLHALAQTVANLTIARMRFKVHHPRGRAGVDTTTTVFMTRDESDMLFEAGVTTLEMMDASLRSKFSTPLLAHIHMTSKLQIEAYIYVLSELRQRCAGDRVAMAWKLIENLYHDHSEIMYDTDSSFYNSLGDLTLEAWNARSAGLALCRDSDTTPQFIQMLLARRQKSAHSNGVALATTTADPQAQNDPGSLDSNDFNWDYWNDFLRL